MKKFFILIWVITNLLATSVIANTLVKLLPISIDTQDQTALQRGAKIYMNYCSGCHSLRYMRYNRMAQDLGLTTFDGEIDKDLLFNNLISVGFLAFGPVQATIMYGPGVVQPGPLGSP